MFLKVIEIVPNISFNVAKRGIIKCCVLILFDNAKLDNLFVNEAVTGVTIS